MRSESTDLLKVKQVGGAADDGEAIDIDVILAEILPQEIQYEKDWSEQQGEQKKECIPLVTMETEEEEIVDDPEED